jgi:hypothetical protein
MGASRQGSTVTGVRSLHAISGMHACQTRVKTPFFSYLILQL